MFEYCSWNDLIEDTFQTIIYGMSATYRIGVDPINIANTKRVASQVVLLALSLTIGGVNNLSH
jgi:hypothetical protein